jgi:hypothetical protein
VLDPEPHGFALILVGWIRIQEGKMTTKIEKSGELLVLKNGTVPDVLFLRAEGIYWSLDVLFFLGIKKLQFL